VRDGTQSQKKDDFFREIRATNISTYHIQSAVLHVVDHAAVVATAAAAISFTKQKWTKGSDGRFTGGKKAITISREFVCPQTPFYLSWLRTPPCTALFSLIPR